MSLYLPCLSIKNINSQGNKDRTVVYGQLICSQTDIHQLSATDQISYGILDFILIALMCLTGII